MNGKASLPACANDASFRDPLERAIDTGVAALVIDGIELRGIMRGPDLTKAVVLEALENAGMIRRGETVVMFEARLDLDVPSAVMPCSKVSGMTAQLLYGDPGKRLSWIKGQTDLCVQDGVLHLRRLAHGDTFPASRPVREPETEEIQVSHGSMNVSP